MKLKAAIAGKDYAVELRVNGERVVADLAGHSYDLELRATNGGYLLIHNGRVFDCRVEGRPESGKTVDVTVGAQRFAVTVTDPKRLRSGIGAVSAADGAARILAPMPGKVVRVMTEVGAQIESGAGVMVVEAMKMQNEMRSPKAGKVVALNVEAGATVNAGDVLAVIE